MKFKFKATEKDIIKYVLGALLFLYVVAIGVLNLSYFSKYAIFYGFNPIEAFFPEYIVYTITFFIAGIVLVAISVTSHFFEREKGLGFKKIDKKNDGYETWAKEKEIKSAIGMKSVNPSSESYSGGGVPLIVKEDELWVDDGESHSLIVGATGSGKTSCMVQPLVNILAKHGESMIITDPKGEIYRKNYEYLKAKNYNIVVLNFREPQKGNAWNPLTLPYDLYKSGNSDKSNELLRDLAINILSDEKTDDPFWQNTAADFFTGLAQGLFQDVKDINQINLNSIILMLTVGEKRLGSGTYMKEYFSSKDEKNSAYINASGTVNAPNETQGGIISVFRQKVNIFAMAENLSEMLSYSDFDIMDIGRKKTAVFLVIQDEKKTYHALATIFIKQCYESLIDVAQNNPDGKLKVRTNFILDEFANLPALKDVTTMITAARSRQIRFNLIIQNFAQLNQVYGAEEAETIKGNCANTIYLLSSELKSLEEISKLAGERKIKTKDKEEVRPLITVAELQRLKFKDAIILKHRNSPFKTSLKFASEINWNMPNYSEGKFPERVKREIEYFNLKDFVDESRQKKMLGAQDMYKAPRPMDFGIKDRMPEDIFKNNPYLGERPPVHGINSNEPENSSFDIDELIKKIDAKIAELEAEEEQEKKEDKPITEDLTIKEEPKEAELIIKEQPKEEELFVKEESKEEELIVKEEPVTEELKINTNIDDVIKSIKEEDNSDDQFFDDFFSDKE